MYSVYLTYTVSQSTLTASFESYNSSKKLIANIARSPALPQLQHPLSIFIMNSVTTSMILIPSLLFVSFYFVSIVRYHTLISRNYEPLLIRLHEHTTNSNTHHDKASAMIETENGEYSNSNTRNPSIGEVGKSVSDPTEQLHESATSPISPWSHPFIHIVTTRFMQEQAHLLHLTRARFELFEAICFPSMVNQEFKFLGTDEDIQRKFDGIKIASSSSTTETHLKHSNLERNVIDPHIIWIIKIDPQLEEVTKKKLVHILKPYPNFYLIGTNANTPTWRAESDLQAMLNESEIYTGDRATLMRVSNERSKKIMLETRLDADDGLHRIYLQSMQQYALKTLTTMNSDKERNRPAWAALCPLKNLEWFSDDQGSSLLSNSGSIKLVFNRQYCITAGLTIVSSPRVDPTELNIQHHKLFHLVLLKGCGLPNKRDCVKLVSKPAISAIRARTLTSAGMKDVGVSSPKADTALHPSLKHEVEILRETERRSSMLLSDFGIEDRRLERVKTYFEMNGLGIAKDNLMGQCTNGHSCKDSSKEKLQKIIQYLKDSTETTIKN